MKIGLITDIHEDIVSLKHILQTLEKSGCDQVICLGDIVGFIRGFFVHTRSRNAGECLRLVRSSCSHVIAGNHDLYAIRKLPVYRGGFRFPGNWYNLSIKERNGFAEGKLWLYENESDNNLDHRDHDYIARLPEYAVTNAGGTGIMFSHFLYPSLTGSESHSPTHKQGLEKHFDFMQRMECDLSFFGHVHTEGVAVSYEPQFNIFPRLAQPFDILPFGTYKLKSRRQCLGLPAVADSGSRNGVAVFDSAAMEIQIIQVKENLTHFVKK